jgi:hypothetical protein
LPTRVPAAMRSINLPPAGGPSPPFHTMTTAPIKSPQRAPPLEGLIAGQARTLETSDHQGRFRMGAGRWSPACISAQRAPRSSGKSTSQSSKDRIGHAVPAGLPGRPTLLRGPGTMRSSWSRRFKHTSDDAGARLSSPVSKVSINLSANRFGGGIVLGMLHSWIVCERAGRWVGQVVWFGRSSRFALIPGEFCPDRLARRRLGGIRRHTLSCCGNEGGRDRCPRWPPHRGSPAGADARKPHPIGRTAWRLGLERPRASGQAEPAAARSSCQVGVAFFCVAVGAK